METLLAFINNVLGPISVVVGLLVAIPVFWTWYEIVLGRRRRTLRWLREVRHDPGARPALLMVDLLPGKDCHTQMERYIAERPELAAIPQERRFNIQRAKPLTPDDLAELVREIRACAADIARTGCDTVHCLYAGPTAAAALIGAEFANGARFLIYQHSQGRYENWGPLRHLID